MTSSVSLCALSQVLRNFLSPNPAKERKVWEYSEENHVEKVLYYFTVRYTIYKPCETQV